MEAIEETVFAESIEGSADPRRCSYHSSMGQGCQFDDSDGETREVDGRRWCLFHLPSEHKTAESFDAATGHYRRHATFDAAVSKVIAQAKAENRTADFTGVVFPAAIAFPDLVAAGTLPDICFAETIFHDKAVFEALQFSGVADFRDAVFCREAAFNRVRFFGSTSFETTVFREDAYFKNIRFRGNVDFSNAHFHGATRFGESSFIEDAIFTGARFEGYAGFNNIEVYGETFFTQASLHGFANFMSCRFERDAHFTKAAFLNSVDFSKTQFRGSVTFNECLYGRDAVYTEFQVGGVAKFERTLFHEFAEFSTAKFERDTRFNRGTFQGLANFNDTFFGRDAGFTGVRFAKALNCRGATFLGHVSFVDSDFGQATFDGVEFHNDVSFMCSSSSAELSRETDEIDLGLPFAVSFHGAKFRSRAIFAHRQFSLPAEFKGTQFTLAPQFYGAIMPAGSNFSACRFLDRGTTNEQASWAYHSLKLIFDELDNRATAKQFLALEQQSSNNQFRSSRLPRWLNTLYTICAGNGDSLFRPLLGLGITTLLALFWNAYGLFAGESTPVLALSAAEFEELLKLTVLPIFAPFWSFADDCARCGVASKIAMTLQSILSLVWMGLFVLALRRRTRNSEKAPKKALAQISHFPRR